jgi:hypothetical protein
VSIAQTDRDQEKRLPSIPLPMPGGEINSYWR